MCESTASVLYPHSKSKQTFGMNESSRNVSLILCWFPYRLSVQKQYRCCLPVNCHNRHSMGIMAIENNRHNCHALQIRNIHSRGGNHIWIIFGFDVQYCTSFRKLSCGNKKREKIFFCSSRDGRAS